jgi:Zn-dependent protease
MDFLLLIPVLLLSFTVHEFAHAWVALREGDPTAARLGRVTLNPIPHIDVFGTLLVPALLLATRSGFLIGWAKPVPVEPRNFRHPRWSDVKVATAGVAANLLLAALLTLVMVALVHARRSWPEAGLLASAEVMVNAGIRLNFLLVVFNLLPVPPLDGATVLYRLLPPRLAAGYARMQGLAMVVFLALMLTGMLSWVLWPATLLEQLSWWLIQSWT